MKLTQNTILITGGTSGIGLEFARQFLALGNTVIVTGRDKTKLDRAQMLLPGLHTIQSDVSHAAAREQLFEAVTHDYPDLNVLINNAGIMRRLNLRDQAGEIDDLNLEIDTNLVAPLQMTRRFLPHLKRRESAAIVNISSGLAFIPFPAAPVYGATKAALHSFTVCLRVQLRATNVRVFEVVAPLTNTPLNAAWEADLKGAPMMDVSKMVGDVIRGLKNNRLEIRPGPSQAMVFLSRLAPGIALRLLSANVESMLAHPGGGLAN